MKIEQIKTAKETIQIGQMNEYNYPKEHIKKVKEGLQFENWTNKNGRGNN